MKKLNPTLTRTLTRLASLIAGLVALPLPLVFFTLGLQSNLAGMVEEAKYSAANTMRLIRAKPRAWQLDKTALEKLVEDLTATELPESRRIVDSKGRVLVQDFDSTAPSQVEEAEQSAEMIASLDPNNLLAVMRSANLLESGQVVGQFQVIRNIGPLLLQTALMGLLGIFLGATVLLVLRVYPLRALKRTLDTLADEKERAEITLQSIGDAVIAIDGEAAVQSFNPAAEKIFGYPAREVIGRNVKMLLSETSASRFDAYLKGHPAIGQAYLIGIEREVTAKRSNGEVFPADLRISEFYLNGHRQIIGSMRDITERRRARDEIMQLNATLEARVEKRTVQLKLSNEQLGVLTERLRQLAAHQESVREAERTRIAHELHDELGGLLASVRFDISRLGQMPAVCPDQVARLLKSQDAAIESTRAIISDLRPPVIDYLGLWGAIEWYATELANRRGLQSQVSLAPELEDLELTHDVSISLFRIVQEALNNIVKHAKATSIAIHVRRPAAGLVEVEIADDGKGLSSEDLAKAGHWGIMGMRERVRSHEGELAIESTPGRGTTLRATVRIA